MRSIRDVEFSSAERSARPPGFLFLLSLSLTVISVLGAGCGRVWYRQTADRDASSLIGTRQIDERWHLPFRPVAPFPDSRMSRDPCDCGPQPLDDASANAFLRCPDGKGVGTWYDSILVDPEFEYPTWLETLPRSDSGQVHIDDRTAVELALLHSRTYQDEFENVWLAAVDLTGNQFEFQTRWLGGTGLSYSATGADGGDQRQLDLALSRLGFSKALATGGEIATNLANSLVWNFGPGGVQTGSATLVTTITQPLLRGAFRHVRLESLTQSERNLLYSVREFARFRRQFHIDVISDYLQLVSRKQEIRNQRLNLANLEKSLDEYEFYVRLETASQIQRDQILQQYQGARVSLLAAEQDLISSLDQYKFSLGLPAWLSIEIDESILEPFEFSDPDLIAVQQEIQQSFLQLLQVLPPEPVTSTTLREVLSRFRESREKLAQLLPAIEAEYQEWDSRLKARNDVAGDADERIDNEQQKLLAGQVNQSLRDLRTALLETGSPEARLEELIREAEKAGDPDETPELQPTEETVSPQEVAWQELQRELGVVLRGIADDMIVAQTQIRLFRLELERIELPEELAIRFAHENRVDLMNSRGRVHDAFRRVEVAADALESDLSLTGSVALASDPSINDAFRLDSSAARYTAGVQFDGPLNRLNERNAFRTAQISYQRANRTFVAQRDTVANEVRATLRQLELSRLSFQIARQQLVAATRQLDQAQIDLRRGTQEDANLTLFLLEALGGILDARNNLVGNWIRYRILKMQLFAALDILYLDEQGTWINEQEGLQSVREFVPCESDYFPPGWEAFAQLPTSADSPSGANNDRGGDGVDRSDEKGSEGDESGANVAPFLVVPASFLFEVTAPDRLGKLRILAPLSVQ
jgi:outer membrane protein TolC